MKRNQLLDDDESNNRVNRSARSEFIVVPQVLRAAPDYAKR